MSSSILCAFHWLTALSLVTSTKLIYHRCVLFLGRWGRGSSYYSVGFYFCQVQITRNWMFTFEEWSLDLASESLGETNLDSLWVEPTLFLHVTVCVWMPGQASFNVALKGKWLEHKEGCCLFPFFYFPLTIPHIIKAKSRPLSHH